MTPRELASRLRNRFGELISEPVEFRGEISITIADPNRLPDVATCTRDDLGFDFLLDITSVDNYGDDPRWTVVYELYGLAHRCHLRLKLNVSEEHSSLPSVTGIWPTADWHEREIFDMMGLRFQGHPDLRRILMWEGYPYHPLRKDFPLAGRPTELPEVAFTRTAPQEGGPFVTLPGARDAIAREPRVKTFEP